MASGTRAPSTIVTINLTGQTEFNIPFEYLARKFVIVTLLGVDRKVLTLNTDYRFVSKTRISLANPTPAGYTQLEIRRETSATERLVDYHDGSILRAYDLNLSQIQTLHVADEGRDIAIYTLGSDDNGNLDARGRRIVNLAEGIDLDDAVTRRQLELLASDGSAYMLRNDLSSERGADIVNFGKRNLSDKLKESLSIKDFKTSNVEPSDYTESVNEACLNADTTEVFIPQGTFNVSQMRVPAKSVYSRGIINQNVPNQNFITLSGLDGKHVNGLRLIVNKTPDGQSQSISDVDSHCSTVSDAVVYGLEGNGFGLIAYGSGDKFTRGTSYSNLKFKASSDGTVDKSSGGLLLSKSELCHVSNVYGERLGRFGTLEFKNDSRFNVASNVTGVASDSTVYYGTDSGKTVSNNMVSNIMSVNAESYAINVGQAENANISNVTAYSKGNNGSNPHGVAIVGGRHNTIRGVSLVGFDDTGKVHYPIRLRNGAYGNYVELTQNSTLSKLVTLQDTAARNHIKVNMAKFDSVFASGVLGDTSYYAGGPNTNLMTSEHTRESIGSTSGKFLWMPSYVTRPALKNSDKWQMVSSGDSRAAIAAGGGAGIKFVSNCDSSPSYAGIVLSAGNGLRLDLGQDSVDGSKPYLSLLQTGVVPSVTNSVNLGSASKAFAGGYVQSALVVTSDARVKTDPLPLTDNVLDAWGEVHWVSYQYLDRVALKGAAKARHHVGLTAQGIIEAFTSHGLDPFKYGIVCHDTWGDSDDDSAGERYGVRYEEALALEAAYQRRRLDRIEQALDKLMV